jgi:hypothetical protein
VRRVATLSILALVLVLGSCGDSDSEETTVGSSPGPTGAPGPGGAGKEGQGGSGGRKSADSNRSAGSADSRFGEKVSFLEKSFFGSKSQVVYFIARKGQQPLDQAKRCVQRNLRKAPSAYCYAFPSERAFRFSRVSRRPPAGMKRPCWNAYWGKPRNRRPIGSASNPAAGALQCPDAIG